MLRQLREGGDVARAVLRDLFPNSILLRPNASGLHLWAEFTDQGPIELLYDSIVERFAAVVAKFPLVDNNGSGGAVCAVLSDLYRLKVA